ncbi:MAG: DUF1592 domain-containing protein [Luteolibacter sp.]
MPRRAWISWKTGVSIAGVLLTGLAHPLNAEIDFARVKTYLTTYCIECHGAEKQKGDRRFDELSLPASKADTLIELKDILDQMHLGDMPPEDSLQPPAAEQKAILEMLNLALSEGREKLASTEGTTTLRRMNRREYINTIGDLFAMNMDAFDPTASFPRDQAEENMDNLGDVLQTSGYLLDQYIEAADAIVKKVFAHEAPHPEEIREFKFGAVPGEKEDSKNGNKKLLHLYECIDTPHHENGYAYISQFKDGVPADGFYEIKVLVQAANREHPYDPKIFGTDPREPFRLGIVPGDIRAGPLEMPQTLQPMLAEQSLKDGAPAWHTMKVWLDAGQTPRFVFSNGSKNSRKAWGQIAKFHNEKRTGRSEGNGGGIVENKRNAISEGKFPFIRIYETKIRGPIADQWPPKTQQAVLGTIPFEPENMRKILQTFANRAFRRPATQEEVDRLMTVAERRLSSGLPPREGLKEAMKDALKAALCSPAFLYLSQDALPVAPGSKARPRLDTYALASRLSYFLWSTMPDGELLRTAQSQELAKPEVLLAQTRRMLASPRSNAFIKSFLDSWLNLRDLGTTPPDRNEFELYYAKNLGHAFKEETRLFMRDLIERDASILNFLDSDYSFVNQALASHYQLGDLGNPARAHEFRKVPLKNSNRGGLLGMGSVLTVSANGIDTSPVVRGVFLLENILGTPPPPPPDDVPAIDPDVRGASSIRDLLSKHRDSPNCFSCHQKIDPLGFALENFDPVGGWRTTYGKKIKIDTAGELPNGDQFTDVAGLKKVLLKRQDLFTHMLTERLLSYACGRRIDAFDDPTVTKIATEMPARNHGLRTLIEAVVTSEPFLCR